MCPGGGGWGLPVSPPPISGDPGRSGRCHDPETCSFPYCILPDAGAGFRNCTLTHRSKPEHSTASQGP